MTVPKGLNLVQASLNSIPVKKPLRSPGMHTSTGHRANVYLHIKKRSQRSLNFINKDLQMHVKK